MRLPRDLSGHELAKLLGRYGDAVVRQSGSHLQLKTAVRGTDHHVTIPSHAVLKVGTLHAIISSVAAYLGLSRSQIMLELFGR